MPCTDSNLLKFLESRALHPVNFDIDHYIDSGALGFRVDYNQPTESIQLTLTMTEQTAKTFYESQLSKDQTITPIEENIVEVTATVPFTSQLVWWLRSFGKNCFILSQFKYTMLCEKLSLIANNQ